MAAYRRQWPDNYEENADYMHESHEQEENPNLQENII